MGTSRVLDEPARSGHDFRHGAWLFSFFFSLQMVTLGWWGPTSHLFPIFLKPVALSLGSCLLGLILQVGTIQIQGMKREVVDSGPDWWALAFVQSIWLSQESTLSCQCCRSFYQRGNDLQNGRNLVLWKKMEISLGNIPKWAKHSLLQVTESRRSYQHCFTRVSSSSALTETVRKWEYSLEGRQETWDIFSLHLVSDLLNVIFRSLNFFISQIPELSREKDTIGPFSIP